MFIKNIIITEIEIHYSYHKYRNTTLDNILSSILSRRPNYLSIPFSFWSLHHLSYRTVPFITMCSTLLHQSLCNHTSQTSHIYIIFTFILLLLHLNIPCLVYQLLLVLPNMTDCGTVILAGHGIFSGASSLIDSLSSFFSLILEGEDGGVGGCIWTEQCQLLIK